MKILILVGTRPEIIKLSEVINKIDKNFHLCFVHSGQNYDYELNEIFYEDLGIRKPDVFLEISKKSAIEAIGEVISKLEKVIDNFLPDALLLLGDTNSCLGAITAKRKKIPIFHMEAGNRCFDQRVPEEINRKIVDHISDINLTYTEHARRYLISEGMKPDQIIKTGSPMLEVINKNLQNIKKSKILTKLKLKKNDYFLVSAHREENVDDESSLNELLTTLTHISKEFNKKIIFSTHPRTQKLIKKLNRRGIDKIINFLNPFGFSDYIKLQMNSYCVISDSGTVTEEASILNFPAITIRNMHERPEGMDQGVLIMSGLDKENVTKSIKVIKTRDYTKNNIMVTDYNCPNVSEKVMNIILSYTEYVNRNTWKKTN